MTWAHYLAGVCKINDRLTRLTLQEADVLCAMLMSHPDVPLKIGDLAERVWPDATHEPDWAAGVLTITIMHLRRRGVSIESRRAFGYRISAEACGHCEPARLAA